MKHRVGQFTTHVDISQSCGEGVSVVIPTYNYAHFLSDAVESIRRQTLPAREIIVVDDGSVDDPAQALAHFPSVKMIRTENRGLASARNTGLAAATGKYIVFLDADDLLMSEALASGVACLEKNREAAFGFGAFLRFDRECRPVGDPVLHELDGDARISLLRKNYIGAPATVLYNRAKLLECGGFNPAITYCEDYELYLRITRKYPVVSHRTLVAMYRLHGSNMSGAVDQMLAWHLKVLAMNQPSPDEASAAHAAWCEGMKMAAPEHALRAWMDQSPGVARNWRNRLYMLSKSPLWTLRGIVQSMVWRVAPEAIKDVLRVCWRSISREPARRLTLRHLVANGIKECRDIINP